MHNEFLINSVMSIIIPPSFITDPIQLKAPILSLPMVMDHSLIFMVFLSPLQS